ncbi:MAG: hypothetical protein JXB29_11520 [Sedimentisphaerales bacterium]|nr:hypothetical protein [Sedimentisphaerales bacterium]
MASNKSWDKIFQDYNIYAHNFNRATFRITAAQIKRACQDFTEVGQKEVRILCKQDSREDRPQVFVERGLFILPIKNGEYVIVKGEGYVDIPKIDKDREAYASQLHFHLDTSLVGNSEMQHLDFAYASSLIRSFMNDNSLVLTIRGRKYTPQFSLKVGSHIINVRGVQTEVDAGYEGKTQVVLVEAKSPSTQNVIIRQLYYPFRQWQARTQKQVVTLFFQKSADTYSVWHFRFNNIEDYNSIELVNSHRFKIVTGTS